MPGDVMRAAAEPAPDYEVEDRFDRELPMEERTSEPRVVRFGVFEVDLAARELRKRGVRVRLQEQPLQVLALLVERPGEVVTREELKRRLWNGVVVDFDHGLNATVNKLRDALGDAADTPRFVETLPRRGYRFIYPLDGAPAREAAAREVEPAAPPRRRWAAGAAALAALAVVALVVVASRTGGGREPPLARLRTDVAVSLAVLPLRNVSGDPRQDDLADGLSEGLVAELGKIGALQVLSYPSVLRYRGGSRPLPEIARDAGVDAFVEGTVLRVGERVRLKATLVQASPERHLWAESYDVDVRDVPAMQGQLARDVARRIRVAVSDPERARLTSSRRVDAEAYEAYLLGRAHLNKTPTPASFERAKAYFEQAIRKDPGYAPAYAGLGELQVRHRGLARSHEDARIQTRQWAERALALDDTLADAHAVLATAAMQDWDWAGAEREYRRALELNPSHAFARIRYAMLLYGALSRPEDGAREAQLAQRVDPTSPYVNTWAAAAYVAAGRVDDGIGSAEKALELDPAFADASLVLGRTYVTQGKHERAVGVLRKALIFERQPHVLGALAHAYARGGHRREALDVLAELNPIAGDHRGYAQFGRIWAYAGLGDRDRAFAALEKGYQERLGRMAWLNVDPLLEPLRADPRFDDLARRVGLPARSPASGFAAPR